MFSQKPIADLLSSLPTSVILEATFSIFKLFTWDYTLNPFISFRLFEGPSKSSEISPSWELLSSRLTFSKILLMLPKFSTSPTFLGGRAGLMIFRECSLLPNDTFLGCEPTETFRFTPGPSLSIISFSSSSKLSLLSSLIVGYLLKTAPLLYPINLISFWSSHSLHLSLYE